MKRFLLTFFCIFCAFVAFSQADTVKQRVGFTYDLSLSSRGGGGGVYVFFPNGKWAIGLDAMMLKHARDRRIRSAFSGSSEASRYVFDKINRFAIISPFFAFSKDIFPHNSYNSSRGTALLGIGPALGFTRPYYIKYAVPDPLRPGILDLVEAPANPADLDAYTYNLIVGEAGFFKYFSPKKFYPGLSLRANLQFDFSRNDATVRGVQLGLHADIFPQKIPLMYNAENSALFLSATAGFLFGQR